MSYGGSASSGGSIHAGSDVALSNPASGQLLGYSTSLAKWQNQTLSSLSNYSLLRIDDYGADASGQTYSDAAWTAVYTAAGNALANVGAVGTAGNGIVIRFGAGVYKFRVGVVQVLDRRIGLIGQGKQATTIWTDQASGELLLVIDNDPVDHGGYTTAPVGGFSLFGWSAGSGVTGLHIGSRPQQQLNDVSVVGFGTGCTGVLFRNDYDSSSAGSGLEGSDITLAVAQNGSDVIFDGSSYVNSTVTPANGTFDYSRYYIHAVTKTRGQNAAMVQFVNQAHMYGGDLMLTGNISSNDASYSATVVVVGNGSSDTARVTNSSLHIVTECDTATGPVYDFTLNGAGIYSYGLVNCQGIFRFLDTTASFTRGSITNSCLRLFGSIDGPSVTTASPTVAYQKVGDICTYLDSNGLAHETWMGSSPTIAGVTAAIGSSSNGMSVTVNGNERTGQITITTASAGFGDFTNGLVVANLSLVHAYPSQNSRIVLTAVNAVAAVMPTYAVMASNGQANIGFALTPAASTSYTYSYMILGQN